jgi:two-component system, LytTR family, response regulator
MKLRTVIVEDERSLRQRLRRILLNEAEIEIVDECVDGLGALTAVEQHKPDLLLLDIGLQGMSGFDVLRALGRRRLPLIVLVTASDEFAIRAFETRVVDYLLKPSSPERIRSMLVRVREHLALLRGLPPEEKVASAGRRFGVRTGQRTTFITPGQIDWIEASGNYVILHVGRENHFLRETITRLEEELSDADFLRVSRSAIVRVDRVKAIQASVRGRHSVVLHNEQCVPITRGIREVEARLRGS